MKSKRWMLMGICLLSLAAGCAKQENLPGKHDETEITTIASEDVKRKNSDRPKILDQAVPIGESGSLRKISNPAIEENLMQEIKIFQGKLLSSCAIYDAEREMDMMQLRLLDLNSGELLAEMVLQTGDSYGVVVQVCGKQIAVSDAQKGKVYLLDENLQKIKTYDAVGERIFLDSLGEKLYELTSTDGIHVLNLKSGEEQVLLPQTADLILESFCGNNICVCYVDLTVPGKTKEYAGINLDTGKVEILKVNGSFSEAEYVSEIWAGKLLLDEKNYVIGNQKKLLRFEPKLNCSSDGNQNSDLDSMDYSITLTENSKHMLLTATDSDGKQSMALYDTKGMFLSACSFKTISATLYSAPIWCEEAAGYFLLAVNEAGYDELYFWDVSKDVESDGWELIKYDESNTKKQGNEEKAAAFLEKYGVFVKIADQCPTDYEDKTVKPECNPEQIKKGLEILEKACSQYPDGFFQQLYYEFYQTIEINLMGEIQNQEKIEGYEPTAFVQSADGKISIVLNIQESAETVEKNIYHETSHLIDAVLQQDACYRKDALFSEEKWQTFNPEAFRKLNLENGGYYGSYEMMPMEYYQEEFVDYFAEDYGESFATEDRATIFGIAMMEDDSVFGAKTSKTSKGLNPLASKLNYYSQCIRDCFDTSGWPEYTTWEKLLVGK